MPTLRPIVPTLAARGPRLARLVARASLTLLLGVAAGCGDADPEQEIAAAPVPAPVSAPVPAVPSDPIEARPVAPPVQAPAGGAAAPVGAGPRLVFDRLTHDFGTVTDSETYTTRIPFRNAGTETLVIGDVKAACGCTVPRLAKKSLAPGEGSTLEIVFDPKGKQGPTRKKITVISNAKPGGLTELELVADITPLLRHERVQRLGDIPLDETFTHRVPMYFTDPDLRVLAVSVNDPELVATASAPVVDRTDGGTPTYRVDVDVTVPRDYPWGGFYAKQLKVKTRGRWRPEAEPIEYEYTLFLLGQKFGVVQAKPWLFALGSATPGKRYMKLISLRRTDDVPFQVTGARVLDSTRPGVQVEVRPVNDALYEVVISGTAGTERGPLRGLIAVETDVPGEGYLELPFSGRIQ